MNDAYGETRITVILASIRGARAGDFFCPAVSRRGGEGVNGVEWEVIELRRYPQSARGADLRGGSGGWGVSSSLPPTHFFCR